MFIVVHTVKFPVTYGEETHQDNYQLCDTVAEAEEIVSRLISARPHGLVSYAICDVLSASEPHWAE